MNWKNERLTKRGDLEPFFREATKGIFGRQETLIRFSVFDTKLRISIQANRKECGLDEVYYLDAYQDRRSMLIKNVYAYNVRSDEFQPTEKSNLRKGLASIGFKCAASFSRVLGLDRIRIFAPTDDGLSFWPHMGAVADLGHQNEHYNLYNKFFLSPLKGYTRQPDILDKNACRQINRHISTHPTRTWQYVSQLKADVFGEPFYQYFFRNNPYPFTEYYIYMGDPVTKMILEKRIGSFQPVEFLPSLPIKESPIYVFPKEFNPSLPVKPLANKAGPAPVYETISDLAHFSMR